MADIVPELWEKIEKEFGKAVAEDEGMQRILQKIERGEATYEDARRYAEIAGEHCSEALLDNLKKDVLPDGKMYYNIADRTVRPAMENLYELDSAVCRQIQEELNRQANIGLKPVTPSRDDNRISDIVDKLTKYDDFDEGKWLLKDPVTNYSQHIVDNSVKQNAEFQYKSGMEPEIRRISSGNCCEWCNSLAGTYLFVDAPKDVFRRHENCNCTAVYNPGDGKYKDVHTKKQYNGDAELQAEVERRKATPGETRLKTLNGKTGAELENAIDAKTQPKELHVEDIKLLKSVGAKWRNENILDLTTGEMYHFVEGSSLKNVTVFAGKGTASPYRNAWKFADKYGGEAENWQHVKAIGEIETSDGIRKANIHWSQCDGIGKKEFFVKEFVDE